MQQISTTERTVPDGEYYGSYTERVLIVEATHPEIAALVSRLAVDRVDFSFRAEADGRYEITVPVIQSANLRRIFALAVLG